MWLILGLAGRPVLLDATFADAAATTDDCAAPEGHRIHSDEAMPWPFNPARAARTNVALIAHFADGLCDCAPSNHRC